MITGIEHVAICSEDSARLKQWYERVFGMKTVYDNGKGTYFVAAPDKSMFEIMQTDKKRLADETNDAGIRHFALSINDADFDAFVEKIRAEKVEIVTEPTEKNGVKTFFFRDIDGNIFHLIVRPNPLV